MARTETLTNLMARIRELGELRTVYVSEAALILEINSSIAELYDMLVAANQDYYESTQSINVVSGTASYALDATFYKSIGVDVLLADGTYRSLRKYNRSERTQHEYTNAANREDTMYRIRGANMVFIPTPTWTVTAGIRHYYVPAPTKLTTGSDTVDGISGWEDWVIYDCCEKFVGGKEEGDASTYARLKQRLEYRIKTMAKHRDQENPDRIRDINREDFVRVYPRYGRSVP